jgi:DNA ligase D-like protein (predicted ligase)
MRLKFIRPLLPTQHASPPTGEGWSHEIKFDGYRSQMLIDDDEVRILTKEGHDWTNKYRNLAAEGKKLPVENAIIDGEIIVTNEQGLSDFHALASAIAKRQHDLYFVAFDLMHLDGIDLRQMPLIERRARLASIIEPGGRIQFSEALPGDARAIFHLVEQAGIEGVVSKKLDSKYESGRSNRWWKIKGFMLSELEVLGVQREAGKSSFVLLGQRDTHRYAGKAIVSVGRLIRDRFYERVRAKATEAPQGTKKRPDIEWVTPGLIAIVQHLRGEAKLRHASLKDFREE